MSLNNRPNDSNRPISDIAHIVDGDEGDFDCGEKPSKNNELRETKTN